MIDLVERARSGMAPMTSGGIQEFHRLDFSLPDFTRYSWSGEQAKSTWEPRIDRIGRCWSEIEWRAVAAGARRCALQIISPADLMGMAARLAADRLAVVPLEMLGRSMSSYSASAVPHQPGQPFDYRVVIGSTENVASFKGCWDRGDQLAIGSMLGYPECCCEFFRVHSIERRFVDTTWFMATNTPSATIDASACDVQGPPQSNILWRWVSVRAVPHLPCRFDCPRTVELADALTSLGRQAGYGDEMAWLLEILSWPVEWTALHGIAEIKTPILKIATSTDATPSKYVVRRHSNTFPKEGARGLVFPYDRPARQRVTGSSAFVRAVKRPVPPSTRRPGWYAGENGFRSEVAMTRAHRPIVELALAVVPRSSCEVLDLGCGNGALFQTMSAANPHIVPFGIDVDASKIAHAREIFPAFADHFIVGDMFDNETIWRRDAPYTLAILMPGRLLKAPPATARRLLQRLHEHARDVLVYVYEDWMRSSGSLTALAEKAGIRLLSAEAAVRVSLARMPEHLENRGTDGKDRHRHGTDPNSL